MRLPLAVVRPVAGTRVRFLRQPAVTLPATEQSTPMQMNNSPTRMCKACKEARKTVVFSHPLNSRKPKKALNQSSRLVACPKCGTLWETARPGAAERPQL
jgi:hypothetical protein